MYMHLGPTEHNFFSERVIGSKPPFRRSCKPVLALLEPDFSDTAAFGVFPRIDCWVATTADLTTLESRIVDRNSPR